MLAKIQQQEDLTQKRQGSNEALDRAQAALEKKDFGAARAEVGKAREIWPESPRIVEVSAAVEKAESEYREKQQRQEKMVLLLQEARSLNEEGQDTEAVTRLDEILGLDAANVEARTLRQQVEGRRQTRESARQMFELAEKMASASDWPGAKTLLDQVLSLYPDHTEAKELRESVESRIRKQKELESRREHCERALARATEALTLGDLEQARQEVDKARESYPDSPRIPELMGEIERVAQTERAETERQAKVASILAEARALHEAGDEDTAFAKLEELFDLDPGNSDARKLRRAIDSRRRARESTEEFYQKALVRFEADDLPASLAYLEEVFSRQPQHPEAKKLQETVRDRIREQQERRARQRQSEDALARAQDGLRSEDLDRARQEVEKAQAAYPDSPRIAEVRDQIRQAEQERQERKEREERIAGLREEAQSAYETGDEEEALTKIRALLELSPGDVTGLELRQGIEQRRQATAQAERLYRRAEQRFQSDDLSGCLALLEEVFSFQPDHAGAKRLREAVQERSKAEAVLDEKVVASNEALGRARRALSGQDFEQARQEVEIGRQLHPQAGWIAEMATAIEKAEEQDRRRRDQQQQLERLMAKARSLDEAGDEEIALVQLKELLTLEPADVEALKLHREIERRREARQKEERERQERIESNYRRACEAEAASKMARAAKLARAVLAEDGGHAEAIELLERVEEEVGKRQKAEERKRDRIRRLRDSAQTAQMEHRYAEAVQALDEILRLEPDDAEVLQLRDQGQRALEVQRDNAARHAEGQKERRSGLELLRDKRYPESLAALGRAADLLEGDRQVKSAIREAEAALRVEVDRAEIQAGIAGARKQMAEGDLDSARSGILQVLELSPKNALAEELLDSVDRAQEQRSRREKVAALLVQGRLAVSEQSYEDGSERIRQLLSIDPENEEAQGLLKTVEQALEERSKREKVAEVLVESQRAFNEQKFEEAAARIREVLLLDPQNEEAKGLRGTIDRAREEKSKQERIDDLLVQSQQALTKQLFEESALRAREVFALDAENDEARRLLDRVGQAQEKNRIDEEVAELLAQCLEAKRSKNLDQAAHFARQAANLDPENVEAVGLRDQMENEIRALKKDQEKEKRRIARERSAALWSVRMKAVRRVVTVGVVLAVVGWSAYQVYGLYLDWRIEGGLETFRAAIDEGDYPEASQAVDLLSQYQSPEEVAGLWAEMDSKFSTNFADDFTQGLQKWDAPQGWSIDTNPSFTRLSVSGPGLGFVQGKYWHDSEVRFYLEFKTGRAASWIVRAQDQQNYYMFRITPARRGEGDKVFHRFDILDCQEGQTELIDSKEIPDDLGNPGEQFYVTIRASGFQIEHSLQAGSAPKPITLANVEDVTHPGGSFGFGTVEDEEFYVYDVQIAPLGTNEN